MWVDFLLESIRHGKIRRQSSTEGTVSSVLTPRAFSRGVSGEEDEEDVAGVLELIMVKMYRYAMKPILQTERDGNMCVGKQERIQNKRGWQKNVVVVMDIWIYIPYPDATPSQCQRYRLDVSSNISLRNILLKIFHILVLHTQIGMFI